MLSLWSVFQRHNRLIPVITLIFFAGGLAAGFFATPLYASSAVLIVITPQETDTPKVDYMDIMANKQLIKTYNQMVTTTAVLEQAVDVLQNKTTVKALKQAVSVKQLGDTQLMEIRVISSNPLWAAKIANSVSVIFMNHVKDVLKLSNVKLVDLAVENRVPVQPDKLLYSVVSTLVGLIVSVTGCMAFDFVRRPARVNSEG